MSTQFEVTCERNDYGCFGILNDPF